MSILWSMEPKWVVADYSFCSTTSFASFSSHLFDTTAPPASFTIHSSITTLTHSLILTAANAVDKFSTSAHCLHLYTSAHCLHLYTTTHSVHLYTTAHYIYLCTTTTTTFLSITSSLKFILPFLTTQPITVEKTMGIFLDFASRKFKKIVQNLQKNNNIKRYVYWLRVCTYKMGEIKKS